MISFLNWQQFHGTLLKHMGICSYYLSGEKKTWVRLIARWKICEK
ncbi:hypothetical protein M6B38_327870 [Iris pallida]|uniref:Uncharacterized protein n=1 Tax=Iris pallida TaxID=29817 RepID=A0AAX6H6E5_IRIPA|nr:hypothetical protein M6B38_327870 [Iris pallida]